ncbi:hypothetical protein [Gilliamella sp. wkB112]|uniref:hypothetical protein n=1 Tax=Gilliamella sp. wkB112 TaxID=3120257 RepID=UPI00080E14AA|nr:hypothetical protein [Gilliamella apicola]OCG00743.1 hypothetical protein A9G12_02960 [Gilliamella apicola]
MSIKEFLDNYKNSFDKRSKAFIEECISYGMTEKEAKRYAKQKIFPGSIVDKIPTLDTSIYQTVTPQLKDRFLYAGSWKEIGETFLSIDAMIKLANKPKFKKWVKSMRENWEDSAPWIYLDKQLSVISVMSEDEGDYTLAVWNNPVEPEIWRYSGQSEQKFKDLLGWLNWLNGN